MKINDRVETAKGSGTITHVGDKIYGKGYGRLIVVRLEEGEITCFEKDVVLIGSLQNERKKIGEFPNIATMLDLAIGIVIGVVIISIIYAVVS